MNKGCCANIDTIITKAYIITITTVVTTTTTTTAEKVTRRALVTAEPSILTTPTGQCQR